LISGLTEYVILLDILLAYPNLLGTKGYVVVDDDISNQTPFKKRRWSVPKLRVHIRDGGI